jgi:transcriptional regulator with XRE-family HTH domain
MLKEYEMGKKPTGVIIYEERKKLGLTQAELAEKAGISVQYERMIERGSYSAVSPEFKRRLANALGWSVFALFPEVPMTYDAFSLLKSRFGSDLVIPERQVAYFKEVLSQLDEDQFEELIWSGTRPADVKKIIRRYAKEFNIEIVE